MDSWDLQLEHEGLSLAEWAVRTGQDTGVAYQAGNAGAQICRRREDYESVGYRTKPFECTEGQKDEQNARHREGCAEALEQDDKLDIGGHIGARSRHDAVLKLAKMIK
jgi:hypothetical protein